MNQQEQIERIASDLSLVLALSEGLKKIGSIENGIALSEKRVEEVKGIIDEQMGLLDQVNGKIAGARAEVDDASERAKKIVADAEQRAADIENAGRLRVDAIIAKAHENSRAIEAAASSKATIAAAKASAEVSKLTGEMAALQKTLAGLEEQIANSEKTLANLTENIERARRAAAQILGG